MKRAFFLITKPLSGKWRDAIFSGLSVAIGILIGPVLEQLSPSVFEDKNLIYVVFVVIALVFIIFSSVIVSMWKETNQQVDAVNKYSKEIVDSIGQRVRLVSVQDAYKETQRRVKRSKKEILMLTNYVFDWEKGEPVFDKAVLSSKERIALYSQIRDKIEEKLSYKEHFKFSRIVQVPKGNNLSEVFPFDGVYYKEFAEFIVSVSVTRPELASLRTIEPLFTNTFTLIDREFLFLEFNVFTPDSVMAFTPFVMLIDDPKSDIVSNMVTLHQRFEAVSTMVKEIDSKKN